MVPSSSHSPPTSASRAGLRGDCRLAAAGLTLPIYHARMILVKDHARRSREFVLVLTSDSTLQERRASEEALPS